MRNSAPRCYVWTTPNARVQNLSTAIARQPGHGSAQVFLFRIELLSGYPRNVLSTGSVFMGCQGKPEKLRKFTSSRPVFFSGRYIPRSGLSSGTPTFCYFLCVMRDTRRLGGCAFPKMPFSLNLGQKVTKRECQTSVFRFNESAQPRVCPQASYCGIF